MNKKGFISTALIYTFFILFLVLMVFLLNNYSSTRYIVDRYRYDIEEELYELSNADINVYTYVWSNRDKEYKYVDKILKGGYQENISYCKNKSTIEFNDGEVTIGAKGREFCYLYFEAAGDVTTPKITASDGKGETSWHKGGVSLSFSGSTIQSGSGGIAYFYSTDASNINNEGTSTGAINTEGTIIYYAKACNTYDFEICSEVASYELKIDNTGPELTVLNTLNGSEYTGGWTNSDVLSTLTFSDASSGIDASSLKWSTNEENWNDIPNNSTERYADTWTSNRNGTAYYQICDVAGNCTNKGFPIKIDKNPPTVSFGINGISTASYTCNDTGGSNLTGATSGTRSLTGTSNYTYTVTCTDKAGNSTTDSHVYIYSSCARGEDTCKGGYKCHSGQNYADCSTGCSYTAASCSAAGGSFSQSPASLNSTGCCTICGSAYCHSSYYDSCATGHNTCEKGFKFN